MIRDDIKTATVTAMKAGDKETTATLRLISAAIKNRDIEVRTGGAPANDDQLVTEVLQKMVKQRRESADIYRKNGREDRAATEEGEIAVITRAQAEEADYNLSPSRWVGPAAGDEQADLTEILDRYDAVMATEAYISRDLSIALAKLREFA